VTIGYDTSNPDSQLISNLVQTQLAAPGLTAKVQGYPLRRSTAGIGNAAAAPEIYTGLVWPDAPSPYTVGPHRLGRGRWYQLPQLLVAEAIGNLQRGCPPVRRNPIRMRARRQRPPGAG